MKYLVIVESPNKVKTIEKYLGSDYVVTSSVGHIRDLATTGKYGFGIDVENNFEPNYKTITGKGKVVTQLKKEAKSADKILLATDPDREGEAISYHLKEVLGLDENDYDRIVFNEVTKKAVLESLDNSRKIDYNLVKSQETRRFLDRIIGFRLSKVMQSKIGSKSAGRVQSVALKLIVDREKEILAFVVEEYHTIHAYFDGFETEAFKYKNKALNIPTQAEADSIINSLSKSFEIESVVTKEKSKHSKPPFITSTLQQEASNKLGFSSKRTMGIAQKLYEGIKVDGELQGLITYMRTDSIRLSDDFVKDAKNYITDNYGSEYVGSVKASKAKENVQDAHEAIRPTSIKNTPSHVKNYLTEEQYKLYRLIYFRTLASIMKSAKVNGTTIILNNNDYKFKATGQTLIFDGYLKAYGDYEKSEEKILPDISNYHTKIILATSISSKLHYTEPKPRYTEAKLIKELEEKGIGRPSTYSSIISTLSDRGYVEIIDKKFKPTEIGIETSEALDSKFSDIINVEYTAHMESDLDLIAEGDLDNIEMLKEFYGKFTDLVDNALSTMEKKEAVKTGEACPNCGKDLVVKRSRYGEFVACSNYPECKYIKNNDEKVRETTAICKCPSCDGNIIAKPTRRGKLFYGCSNYPKCKEAFWDMPTGNKCSECGSMMVMKKDKEVCPNCTKKVKEGK